VLSTLHTNDAPSTITRLLTWGRAVSGHGFGATGAGAASASQDLCDCKQPTETPKDELKVLGATDEEIATANCQRGVGCQICGGTATRVRALYEVMPFKDALKELVLQGVLRSRSRERRFAKACEPAQSGVRKICEGVTSVDEVARITAGD